MVQYASSVKKGYQATSDAMKAETNAYNRAHKTWVAGMLELKHKEKTPVYPDANSTLRLTYGKIGSYEPADGKEYLYYTTLKGVMERKIPTIRNSSYRPASRNCMKRKISVRMPCRTDACLSVLQRQPTTPEVTQDRRSSMPKANRSVPDSTATTRSDG